LSFSQLTADWVREDFYLPMLLLVVGQPMAVIPLLMLSTSVIAPIEGPFASAWFNTVRGFSGVVATAVIGALG
ncbi:EmrB/QacA family drug resistance transporter, partial [Pseudomonas aeruginosa]